MTMTDSAATSLIAAFPEPVLLADAKGIVTFANLAAMELFGRHSRGMHLRAILRQPEAAGALEQARAGDPEAKADFVVSGHSGEAVWRVTPRVLGDSTMMVTLRDVSDIAAAETQRRDFVANVSHELRSPLTVLNGFIETLQGPAGNDPAARAEFLGIMAQETARMTGLVADLLSLSRVESSERVRPRTPVSVTMAIRSTLAALRPQIAKSAVQVICDLPEDLPDVPGDHDQLVQVFRNIVENALRYGAGGGRVDIRARPCPAVSGIPGPAVRVTVQDFGEGVDPVFIPRLTERFYRADTARSRASGGTGLGLAIVKHIVGRHRGRLTIRSASGQGTSVDVVLPCADPAEPG